ncbi:MAG: nitronate monooxygenase [Actinobacteria bacterium]|nr:nitronate monooxygenase [Actinomycetota bacterium]
MFDVRELVRPIVQAPMAGGISTPALAAAVSNAGGLGFLAAGYREPEGVAVEVAELRALTDGPFGLNLFAPAGPPADARAVERYAARIAAEGELGEPRHDDDHFDAKLALAAELAVPVVSTTFGAPAAAQVEALHAAGCAVWVTVTTPAEAELALAAGADTLVLQGFEAGGHRGAFDDLAPNDLGLLALLRLVAGLTEVPVIASGGIFDGAGIAAVLAGGAAGAQLGTAFMLCPEAATSPAHRAAIESDAPTAVTRAFTGRRARGIVNRFMREHDAVAPSAYPEIHHLTAPLRRTARESEDPARMHLWAGQSHSRSRSIPAAELVAELAVETRGARTTATAGSAHRG